MMNTASASSNSESKDATNEGPVPTDNAAAQENAAIPNDAQPAESTDTDSTSASKPKETPPSELAFAGDLLILLEP